jgi:hypothetical protein
MPLGRYRALVCALALFALNFSVLIAPWLNADVAVTAASESASPCHGDAADKAPAKPCCDGGPCHCHALPSALTIEPYRVSMMARDDATEPTTQPATLRQPPLSPPYRPPAALA